MKKLNFAASSLLVITMALTSCQNESVDESIVQSIVTPTEIEGEKIPGSYIVVFKEEKLKTASSKLANITYSTRDEKAAAYRKIEGESKKTIETLLSRTSFDKSKIASFYSTYFSGISLKDITAKELLEISKNPSVKAIYYDQVVPNPGSDVIVEDVVGRNTKAAMAQTTTCATTNAGGSISGAASSAWIWVIDTGIDSDHPDLNVITDTRYAKSFLAGSSSFEDCNGHGTHVAGIAAAKNNTIGMVGISAGAPVVAVRVFGCSGGATTSSILSAINHVGANDAPGDVVNLSLGGFYGSGCSTGSPYATSLKGLGTAGTRVAIAAGNSSADTTQYSPGCINGTNIFTVASMTCSKGFSSFSNYNRTAVDVIATGSSVYSTYLNGGYATLSGTSMASPVVAGIMHARNAGPATSGTVSSRGSTYPIAVR